MATPEPRIPIREYGHVISAFENGSVFLAPKEELQAYLAALGKARILDDANRGRAAQMGETVRHLLSEIDKKEEAKKPNWARIGVWLALGSYILGFLTAYLALR
jgi:hypothetical protein